MMRGPLLVSSCLSILTAGLITLIWSHRFAGPLRVLSAGIARLRQGNFTMPTRIRDTDTHQELIKEFAQMQDGLRAMLSEDRSRLAKLSARLQEAAAKAPSDDARLELQGLAEELKTIGIRYLL